MKRKRGFLGLVFKFFLVILLILSFFAMLGQKNAITGLEYKISAIEKKKMQLIKEGKHLMAAKARLASIENIRKASVNPEEFQFPDRKKVVYVKTIKQSEPRSASYQSANKSSTK